MYPQMQGKVFADGTMNKTNFTDAQLLEGIKYSSEIKSNVINGAVNLAQTYLAELERCGFMPWHPNNTYQEGDVAVVCSICDGSNALAIVRCKKDNCKTAPIIQNTGILDYSVSYDNVVAEFSYRLASPDDSPTSAINAADWELCSLAAGLVAATAMYPIGSVVIMLNGENPAVLMGGAWEEFKDDYGIVSNKAAVGTEFIGEMPAVWGWGIMATQTGTGLTAESFIPVTGAANITFENKSVRMRWRDDLGVAEDLVTYSPAVFTAFNRAGLRIVADQSLALEGYHNPYSREDDKIFPDAYGCKIWKRVG